MWVGRERWVVGLRAGVGEAAAGQCGRLIAGTWPRPLTEGGEGMWVGSAWGVGIIAELSTREDAA